MEGIILVDKPIGITSHRVVSIIRSRLKIKKVGHAGTLDPLASGLLVIMLGKATKLSNLLISQFKSYEVKMKLFLATDTGDITGKIIKEEKNKIFPLTEIESIISSFDKNYTYLQTPPIYSAIKIKGKKAYEYARKGINIEIKPREVTIKSIKMINYDQEKGELDLSVECSKGTYIRSLVENIAQNLKTIATVKELRRISSGDFNIKQAFSLDKINFENIDKFLLSI